jgi:hypothetical protein
MKALEFIRQTIISFIFVIADENYAFILWVRWSLKNVCFLGIMIPIVINNFLVQ